MPATYWLPLLGVTRTVDPRHVHAAFSRWFDTGTKNGSNHDDLVKPYHLGRVRLADEGWGVEVSVLTSVTNRLLRDRLIARPVVRLGALSASVGVPRLVQHTPWASLACHDGTDQWEVEFVTPTTFRTGNRASPFPTIPALLRAPSEAWAAHGPKPAPQIAPTMHHHLWVSAFDLRSTPTCVNAGTVHGAEGCMTIRCNDPDIAATASSLLRLASYCGVGSWRGRGLGTVTLRAA